MQVCALLEGLLRSALEPNVDPGSYRDVLLVIRCVGVILRRHVTLAPDKCASYVQVRDGCGCCGGCGGCGGGGAPLWWLWWWFGWLVDVALLFVHAGLNQLFRCGEEGGVGAAGCSETNKYGWAQTSKAESSSSREHFGGSSHVVSNHCDYALQTVAARALRPQIMLRAVGSRLTPWQRLAVLGMIRTCFQDPMIVYR